MPVTAPHVRLRYGDKVLDSGSGGVFEHRNPYTGEIQATIPLAGAAEIDEAVELAAAQAESWRRWTPEARRDVLIRFAELLGEHRQEFVDLQALDGGTPTHFGERIVDNSINWTRYYAGWCDKLSGELISTLDTRGYFSYTAPEPYGVVGIIVTWNGPVVSLGMKVIPALAAGNCVVVKPSEFTPFAPHLYAQLLRKAGLPDGVCSILSGGAEAGEALVRHPKVEKVSFTGGPVAARRIMHACAEQLKPAVLELGGKTGSIVFPDAGDLDAVASRAVRDSIGVLAGQGCVVPTRLIVHEDIYDEVVERVTEVAATYRMGDPFDPDIKVGPLINAAAVERVCGMLDRGRGGRPRQQHTVRPRRQHPVHGPHPRPPRRRATEGRRRLRQRRPAEPPAHPLRRPRPQRLRQGGRPGRHRRVPALQDRVDHPAGATAGGVAGSTPDPGERTLVAASERRDRSR